MGNCGSDRRGPRDEFNRQFTEYNVTDADLERNWRTGHCQDSSLSINVQKREKLDAWEAKQKEGVYDDDSDVEEMHVWTKKCIRCIQAIELEPESIRTSEVDAEAALLVFTGTNSHTVRLWTVRRGQTRPYRVPRLLFPDNFPRADRGEVRALQISSEYIVCCTSRGHVFVFDWADLERKGQLLGVGGASVHKAACTALHFEGDVLLVASLDHTISVWNLRSRDFHRLLPPQSAGVLSVRQRNQRAISGGADGKVYVWDLQQFTPLHVLSGHSGPVRALCFLDESGERAAVADDRGFLSVWDVAYGRRVQQWRAHEAPVYALECSGTDPASQRLISASADNTVRISTRQPVDRTPGAGPAGGDGGGGGATEFRESARLQSALDDPQAAAAGGLRQVPQTPEDIRVAYCLTVLRDQLVCGCSDGALLVYSFAVAPAAASAVADVAPVAAEESEEDY